MNILHLKYAATVARLGSLSRASEKLLVAQPNISRSIKELEADLGITIFNRSAKGMELTADGEDLIRYAEDILKQIDRVENIYKDGAPKKKQRLSVSVPRACYISEALSDFSMSLPDSCEVIYKETNSKRTISNVQNDDYKLGIIRYPKSYDTQFKTMLDEKGFSYEMIAEFSYVLIMSKHSPLAEREIKSQNELSPYIEIAHADPYVPSLPASRIVKEETDENVGRRIFLFERASQFDLLSSNPETFMWVSPASEKLLTRYELVQKKCDFNKKMYKDVLIYRRGYSLTPFERDFITALCASKRRHFKE